MNGWYFFKRQQNFQSGFFETIILEKRSFFGKRSFYQGKTRSRHVLGYAKKLSTENRTEEKIFWKI